MRKNAALLALAVIALSGTGCSPEIVYGDATAASGGPGTSTTSGGLGTSTTSGGNLGDAGPAPVCRGFKPKKDYPTGRGPASVVAADLDGDGNLDLAVANASGYSVSVLFGLGGGTFAAKVDSGRVWDPESIAAADVNGDGRPDLVVADFGNANAHTVGVLFNRGHRTFAPERVFPTGGTAPSSVAVADLNGDGKPDLAVVNYEDGGVSVLLGHGDGTFAPEVAYGAGDAPWSIAVADVNGDGKPDLAITDMIASSAVVLLNHGDGTFGPVIDYATGLNPISLAIADLNGDGKPDLAVANGGLIGDGDTLSVLLGHGDGTFAAKVDYPTGTDPQSIAIADVNGDGRPDLVVANTGRLLLPDNRHGDGTTVSVLLGLGDGTFAAKIDYTTGLGPWSVVVADLDGDHKPDLAVANRTDSTVSVLLACP